MGESKELDIRISNIENKLDKLASAIGVSDPETKATKNDIDAYLAVLRASVAVDWGEFCGINDCYKCIVVCKVCKQCQVCRTCTVCTICTSCKVCFECTGCGPCSICVRSSLRNGIKDFESFDS